MYVKSVHFIAQKILFNIIIMYNDRRIEVQTSDYAMHRDKYNVININIKDSLGDLKISFHCCSCRFG